ncbi:MAG: hypothetical protein K2X27_05405 [Candidatus Obscuribacterales bacterium]|nr:hypothetical protein [Candidatus Obscuribacterales bacterium]
MKAWAPTIILILVMFLLIAATRVYIGGPDGIEVVWKGELNFADTVVNVVDYVGLPRREFGKRQLLLAQMEQMGLWDEDGDRVVLHRKRRSSQNEKTEEVREEESPAPKKD